MRHLFGDISVIISAMVRISIPTIPTIIRDHHPVSTTPIAKISKVAAIDHLDTFLARPGPATLLTGAGVSVDSGIRPYRGQDGRYMNPNYQSVPFLSIYPPIWVSINQYLMHPIQSPSRPILVGHLDPTTTSPYLILS
jgi:hypothetical protein